MKTFKIRIIAKFNTKNELFIPGEVHEARRLSYNFMDFKTPFQIVSGKKSGEEVPFKYAVVLPDKPQPTQEQFDRLVEQNRELLDKLERHTDEQLNSEKLLQRIRELETVANGRAEMLKSFSFKLVPYVSEKDSDLNTAIDRILEELEERRDTQKQVELPRDVAKAIEGLRGFNFSNYGILACDAYVDDVHDWVTVIRNYTADVSMPENEMSNGDKLMLALINGYTAVSEKDEAAAMLGNVTALVEEWYHSPATDNDTQVLAEQICDFIREREAAGKAMTI